jgi:NAD(P)-dependent dehydrogenase (short-subunit alcohol dehydrogenase family)
LTTSEMDKQLDGKIALVSGASRGIGRAIAELFAAQGARVVITSRKQEALDQVAGKIITRGGEATAIAAHTGDTQAVEALRDKIKNQYGGLDILVNNAATNPHFGPILTADDRQWDKILDTNLVGYFRMAKASAGLMVNRAGGIMINISSVAGLDPQPGMGVYCVSKVGILMLTRVLAAELAQDNIRVNAIAPGFVKTRFSAAIWDNPQLKEITLRSIPQERFAHPEEIANAALFLASDQSSYMTGATLVIDGGQSLHTAQFFDTPDSEV